MHDVRFKTYGHRGDNLGEVLNAISLNDRYKGFKVVHITNSHVTISYLPRILREADPNPNKDAYDTFLKR
jgi:hypothetical protein